MAITYKKNARNIFVIPFYARFWFWWWLIVVFSALCSTICYFVPSKLCQIGIIGLVAGRYFDDLASVFTDKVSEQSRDNRKIYHTTESRKGSY